MTTHGNETGFVSAVVVLTPSESKRLLGKAVAALPEVRAALDTGRVIIGNGSTNAFVAEEIVKERVSPLRYCAGAIFEGKLNVVPADERLSPYCLEKGQVVRKPWTDFLMEFEAGDVFVKGGNAVDPTGAVGVLVFDKAGGTIGKALPVVTARGAHLIMPVGLEKLVPSVAAAARACHPQRIVAGMGGVPGLIPVVNARVITEVEAFRVLANVDAVPLAAGGAAGCEGSVVLALVGARADVERAYAVAESVKGEPPVAR
ncbi:MAG: hypothetical protein QHJ73_18930 [Armatimonadota bacterium]|nr:hypothetical protein [Armatimonadota bacterium]